MMTPGDVLTLRDVELFAREVLESDEPTDIKIMRIVEMVEECVQYGPFE